MKPCCLEDILKLAEGKPPKRMVVTGQSSRAAMVAVMRSQELGLINPFFCDAERLNVKTDKDKLFAETDSANTIEQACAMIAKNEADILFNSGPLTPGFFKQLTETDSPRKRTINYVSVFVAPKDRRLTLMTDAVVNSQPELKSKIAMLENTISVAEALGIDDPNVAALAPLELVNPAIRSTVDAAILSKMSQRGQFGNALVEGPLAMDNAESASAARHKGIESPVPGNVDIYLFPDIESANITAQFLSRVFNVEFAGILTGAKVPTVIQPPIEQSDSWLINIALAVLLV